MDITEFLKRELSQNYQINSRLGAGGCSIVYDAQRLSDQRHVAIKVLSLPETLEPEEADVTRQRFCREALLMVTLHDPHIAECLDYGVFNGSPCIVLEFIEGNPLDLYLKEYGALPFSVGVDIICQLLDALAVAHSIGVIHRDIKPGNILLTGDDANPSVHLIDFGIASMLQGPERDRLSTKMGSIRGTPSYMAPELFSGFSPASSVSDLYAAGLVLLECLTGKTAITGMTVIEIGFKQAHQELEIPLFIPKCLAKVIQKSCSKVPGQRYQTAQEMNAALKAALPEAEDQRESCASAYMDDVKDSIYKEKTSKLRIVVITLVGLLIIAITVVVTRIVTRPDLPEPAVEKAPAQTATKIEENPSSPENANVKNAEAAPEIAAPEPVAVPNPEPLPQPNEVADSANPDSMLADPLDFQDTPVDSPDPSIAQPTAIPEPIVEQPAAPKTTKHRNTQKKQTAPATTDNAVLPAQPEKEKPKKPTMVIPTNLI